MTRPRWKYWATAYWTCAALHALSHVLDLKALRLLTKTALMPALASGAHSRNCSPLLIAALLMSAAGDTLMEQSILLPAMAMYAAAHACYVALFARGHTRSRWHAFAAYGVLGATMIALLWPGLGVLRGPATAYSLMLMATAVTSSWYGRRTGLGGALFLISDSLIGARLAGHDFPGRGPLVGLTYTTGQYHLVAGALDRR